MKLPPPPQPFAPGIQYRAPLLHRIQNWIARRRKKAS